MAGELSAELVGRGERLEVEDVLIAATAAAGTNAKAEEEAGSSDAWPGVELLGNLRSRYETDADRRDERP